MNQGDANSAGRVRPNRRKAKRHPKVSFVWYQCVDEALAPGISKMCDISTTGLGLYVPREIPVGKTLFLEITLAGSSETLSMLGRIVRAVPQGDQGTYLGIEFTVVPPNHQLKLARLFGEHETQ